MVRRHPELSAVIDDWSATDDQWLLRAAIQHQRGLGAETDVPRVLQLCSDHATDRRFFVAKAIGWALRDLSRIDLTAVAKFVADNPDLPPVARREAVRGLERAARIPNQPRQARRRKEIVMTDPPARSDDAPRSSGRTHRRARNSVSREEVLAAALAIVDADGIEALSMRHLAAQWTPVRCGRTAISRPRTTWSKASLRSRLAGSVKWTSGTSPSPRRSCLSWPGAPGCSCSSTPIWLPR